MVLLSDPGSLHVKAIVLSISALIYGFGEQAAQAGWSDAASGLKLSASSLVISVKKHKRNDDDDDDDDNGKHQKTNKKGKNKKHDSNEQEANDKAPSTTTTPKCDVLWGDYCQ